MSVKAGKGQHPGKLDEAEFRRRYLAQFVDPAFDTEREALHRIAQIAWTTYDEGRKAPRRESAGKRFEDPTYELSLDWLETRARLHAAQSRHVRSPRTDEGARGARIESQRWELPRRGLPDLASRQ